MWKTEFSRISPRFCSKIRFPRLSPQQLIRFGYCLGSFDSLLKSLLNGTLSSQEEQAKPKKMSATAIGQRQKRPDRCFCPCLVWGPSEWDLILQLAMLLFISIYWFI